MAKRKPNFNKMSLTYELEVIKALRERTATREMINDIVADVKKHLEDPVGTLDNYFGRFTQAGVQALQENYAYFPPNEDIVKEKTFKIASAIANSLVNNERIHNHPALFKFILEYLNNKNTEITSAPQYVVVGYKDSVDGVEISPATNE